MILTLWKLSWETHEDSFKKKTSWSMPSKMTLLSERAACERSLMRLRERARRTNGWPRWTFEAVTPSPKHEWESTKWNMKKSGGRKKMPTREFTFLRKNWKIKISSSNNRRALAESLCPRLVMGWLKINWLRWWRSWVKSRKAFTIRRSNMRWWSSKLLTWQRSRYKSLRMN